MALLEFILARMTVPSIDVSASAKAFYAARSTNFELTAFRTDETLSRLQPDRYRRSRNFSFEVPSPRLYDATWRAPSSYSAATRRDF